MRFLSKINIHTHYKRLFMAMAVSLLLIHSSGIPALAGGAGSGSVTVNYIYEDMKFENQNISLYKASGPGPDFADAEAVISYKKEVEKQISSNKLQPVKTEITDAAGSCTFHDLEEGIYFIPSLDIKINRTDGTLEKEYKFDSVLLSLPLPNGDGSFDYDPVCTPKGEKMRTVPQTPAPKTPDTPVTDTPSVDTGTPDTGTKGPGTGDTSQVMPLLIIILCCLVVMIIAFGYGFLGWGQRKIKIYDDRNDLNRKEGGDK